MKRKVTFYQNIQGFGLSFALNNAFICVWRLKLYTTSSIVYSVF
jgi:hypothetical protein